MIASEFDRQRNEQLAEFERAKELLLVRRIRIQRDLQRRDTELVERQVQLDQREEALRERAAALQHEAEMRSRFRKIPLPPAVGKSGPRSRPNRHAEPRPTAGDAFELANPLLESADFTDLLNQVIDDIDTDGNSR